MINNRILELLKEASPDHWDKYITVFQACIGIKLTNAKTPKPYDSKFGGFPDLPKKFEWPTYKGDPLTFLCQINLTDLIKIDVSTELPKTGILYFFLFTEELGEYRFPTKPDEFKVLYCPDEFSNEVIYETSTLRPKRIMNEVSISFFKHYTIPSFQEEEVIEMESEGVPWWEISDEIDFELNEIWEENGAEFHHYLFGHPQALQGTVKRHWRESFLNGNKTDLKDCKASNFRLLLQISLEDQNLGYIPELGDAWIYFGIHEKYLKSRDFSKSVIEIQNT